MPQLHKIDERGNPVDSGHPLELVADLRSMYEMVGIAKRENIITPERTPACNALWQKMAEFLYKAPPSSNDAPTYSLHEMADSFIAKGLDAQQVSAEITARLQSP